MCRSKQASSGCSHMAYWQPCFPSHRSGRDSKERQAHTPHLPRPRIVQLDVQPQGVSAPQARLPLALPQQRGCHAFAAMLRQGCYVGHIGAPRLGGGEGRRQGGLGLQVEEGRAGRGRAGLRGMPSRVNNGAVSLCWVAPGTMHCTEHCSNRCNAHLRQADRCTAQQLSAAGVLGNKHHKRALPAPALHLLPAWCACAWVSEMERVSGGHGSSQPQHLPAGQALAPNVASLQVPPMCDKKHPTARLLACSTLRGSGRRACMASPPSTAAPTCPPESSLALSAGGGQSAEPHPPPPPVPAAPGAAAGSPLPLRAC